MNRDDCCTLFDQIPDAPKQSPVTQKKERVFMVDHFYCMPERAEISWKQCLQIQSKCKKDGPCTTCPRQGLRPTREMVDPNLLDALTDLEGLIEGIQPDAQEDFHRLCEALESCRDFVRDYLDGFPKEERPKMELLLSNQAFRLADEAWMLAKTALVNRVIDESLAYDIGWLGISLKFVSALSKISIEDFPLQDYL
jgi:hypothetical protein